MDTTKEPLPLPPVPCSGVAVVDSDKVFGIKSPCPYCGGKITASAARMIDGFQVDVPMRGNLETWSRNGNPCGNLVETPFA